jgi:hypothetical protein
VGFQRPLGISAKWERNATGEEHRECESKEVRRGEKFVHR